MAMKVIRRFCMIAVWMILCMSACHCQTLTEVITSSRSITGITALPDGTILVASRGGVLCRKPDGAWRKYTIIDGLPDNEILSVSQQNGRVMAQTVRGSARLEGDRWTSDPALQPEAHLLSGQISSARWKGTDCVSTAEGLRIRMGDTWKSIPMPQSKGTHISALLDKGKELWAALYGDGIFAWNGTGWHPVKLALPVRAREIIAMAFIKERLWLGTNADGIWEHDGRGWKHHVIPDEPFDHNCQDIKLFKGALYASTLDNGLMVHSKGRWRRVRSPQISSNTPRQMIVLNDRFYLRNSLGIVDGFDGKTWTNSMLGALPRKQCSVFAADGSALYAGQWGGWSELAGNVWTHHLSAPELQGFQVTAILPDGDRLWVGTQGLGLAQVNRADGSMKLHNEFLGMPDDTIKCLARSGDTVYAGTFSQGLAWMDDASNRWGSAPELSTSQIACLEPDRSDGIYIGARTGLWHRTSKKQMICVMRDIEVQALALDGNKLWVGTRTGLLRFVAGK